MPKGVYRQFGCAPLDLLQCHWSEVPDIDADVYSVLAALPVLMHMAEELQPVAPGSGPRDHRIVAQKQPAPLNQDIGCLRHAFPRQVTNPRTIMISADKMFAARQRMENGSHLAPLRIAALAYGEISQNPKIIVCLNPGAAFGK